MTNFKKIVGRGPEIQKIQSVLNSQDPELVTIWGRRRIGKTFLIRYGREPVEDYFLEVTGQRNGARKVQLRHFADAVSKAFHRGVALRIPETWEDAFRQLEDSIATLPADGRPITLFFDEAPWLDSRRSGFLDALEYFWNTVGTKNPRLKVFVCGSAASWIIHKIVRGKGGWHGRVTRKIWLLPFKLNESRTYLESRGIRLSDIDHIRLYLLLGGVAYYLSLMQKGESIGTFIDRLFFSEAPDLDNEFDELFDSLFNNSEVHKKIVLCLMGRKSGFTREDIIRKTGLPSGGSLNRYIDNLEQSGFIEAHLPLGESAEKNRLYRIRDMFTLFHLRWLSGKSRYRSWQAIVTSQPYTSWAGHSFETLVWNHAASVAASLGIARSDYTVTRADISNSEGKAQVDLLFDVRGGAVYLFELKFSDNPYKITSAEASKLSLRRAVVMRAYKGRRSIIVCLLSPLGVQENQNLREAVDLVVEENALFL